MAHGRTSRHKRRVKLPLGAQLPSRKSDQNTKPKEGKSSRCDVIADDLSGADWLPHAARPTLYGYYVIWRYLDNTKTWDVIFIGRGHVGNCMAAHFAGKHLDKPADQYLTSVPKESRNTLWYQCLKDPDYPYQGPNLDSVIDAYSAKYNKGTRPLLNQAPSKTEAAPRPAKVLAL